MPVARPRGISSAVAQGLIDTDADQSAVAIATASWTNLRARSVFTVTDPVYGAVGNGVANDATAIQAAVSACSAAGGGVVYFPKGTFLIGTTITLPSKVTLQGAGMEATVIRTSGAIAAVTATSANRVSVRDMELDGNSVGTHGLSLTTVTFSNFFERVLIRRFTARNISLTTSHSNTFSKCYLHTAPVGAYLNDCGGGNNFENVRFLSCSTAGAHVVATAVATAGQTLSSCQFDSCGVGVRVENAGQVPQGVYILGCRFEDNTTADVQGIATGSNTYESVKIVACQLSGKNASNAYAVDFTSGQAVGCSITDNHFVYATTACIGFSSTADKCHVAGNLRRNSAVPLMGATNGRVSNYIQDHLTNSDPPYLANYVATKAGPVYDVKAFGAKGNGSTDDSAAIQAAITAITAAGAGGVVFFPAGSYLVNTAIDATDITAGPVIFRGTGRQIGGTTKGTQILGQTGGVVFDCTGSQALVIEDMTIRYGATNASSVAILLARSNVGAYCQFTTVQRCTISMPNNAAMNGGLGSVGVYNYGAEICDILDVFSQADNPLVITSTNAAGIASPHATIITGGVSTSFVNIRGGCLATYLHAPLTLEGDLFEITLDAGFLIRYLGTETYGIRLNGSAYNSRFHGAVEVAHQIMRVTGTLGDSEVRMRTPYTGSGGLVVLESSGGSFPTLSNVDVNAWCGAGARAVIESLSGSSCNVIGGRVHIPFGHSISCTNTPINGTTITAIDSAPTITAAASSDYLLMTPSGHSFIGAVTGSANVSAVNYTAAASDSYIINDAGQAANSRLMSVTGGSQQISLRALNDNFSIAATLATFHRNGSHVTFGGLFTGFAGVSFYNDLSYAGTSTGAGATTRQRGGITHSWVVSSDATRTARVVHSVYDTAAREAIRMEASGTAPMLGFYGVAAVARQTVAAAATDAATTQTLVNDLRSKLITLGLIQ